MKAFPLFFGILLALLFLLNFCYAAEENVAEFLHPVQGTTTTTTTDVAKNGEEDQEEKFKYFYNHKPYFKKPFYKPIPHKYPIIKKPYPHHPVYKKPYPHYPPVFSSHP